jgi:hypothetical protein
MTTGRLVLDNEAAQAIADPAHPKHRRVMAHLDAARHTGAGRTRRLAVTVPTVVRVEAGLDRTAPTSATINRLTTDILLDRPMTDAAAAVQARTGVGPADAHLAAAVRDGDVVLTSDPPDIRSAAEADIRIITV